ncbi:hypothetical protein EJB05_37166, partial [Eragrostis curvula]
MRKVLASKRHAVTHHDGDDSDSPVAEKRCRVAQDGGVAEKRHGALLQGHGARGRPQHHEDTIKQANCSRCSPSLFHKFMDMGLTNDLRKRIEDMGFKGLVNLAPTSLDSRDFVYWLMDIFNPETMKLEIGGGKELPITKHAISCVMGLPNAGIDPPDASNSDAKYARTAVGTCLFPDKRDGEKPPTHEKFNPTHIAMALQKYHEKKLGNLDDDLCLRLFFMVANLTILTPNTDSYIRIADAKLCENLKTIQRIDWCKVVLDNLRDAGRKWKAAKKEKPSIHGCVLKSIIGTCYQELPAAPLAVAPPQSSAAAPAPPHAAPQDHAVSSSVHDPPQAHIQVFPSSEATFGGVIEDLVSQQRKYLERVVKKFDDDMRRAGEIMSNAHNEVFLAIGQLLDEARNVKANGLRKESATSNDMLSEATCNDGGGNGTGLPLVVGNYNEGLNGQDSVRVDHHSSVHSNASMPSQVASPIGPTHVDYGRDEEEHYDNSPLYSNASTSQPLTPLAPRVLYEGVQSVDAIFNLVSGKCIHNPIGVQDDNVNVHEREDNMDQYISNGCGDDRSVTLVAIPTNPNHAANPTNASASKGLVTNTYKRRKTTTADDVNKKEHVAAKQKKEEAATATKKKRDDDQAVIAATAKKKDEEAAALAQKKEGEALAQKKKEAEATALEEKKKEDEAAAALVIMAVLFS